MYESILSSAAENVIDDIVNADNLGLDVRVTMLQAISDAVTDGIEVLESEIVEDDPGETRGWQG